jgi:hypothetical protein
MLSVVVVEKKQAVVDRVQGPGIREPQLGNMYVCQFCVDRQSLLLLLHMPAMHQGRQDMAQGQEAHLLLEAHLLCPYRFGWCIFHGQDKDGDLWSKKDAPSITDWHTVVGGHPVMAWAFRETRGWGVDCVLKALLASLSSYFEFGFRKRCESSFSFSSMFFLLLRDNDVDPKAVIKKRRP